MMRRWLARLFIGSRERQMQEEMAAHLDRAAERLQERGLSPAAARAAAQREFGNLALLQEQARDARGWQHVATLLADLRFALRHFRRTPAVTVTILVALAGGIGVNIFLFALVHSWRTLPAPGISAGSGLVRLRGTVQDTRSGIFFGRGFTARELEPLLRTPSPFTDLALWATSAAKFETGAGVESGVALAVTPNYFSLLGVRPILGSTGALSGVARQIVVVGFNIDQPAPVVDNLLERVAERLRAEPGVVGVVRHADGYLLNDFSDFPAGRDNTGGGAKFEAHGHYAVALAVRQRRREIGVRMALGATAGHLTRFFFRTGFRLTLTGVVLGLPLSVLALRILNISVAVSTPWLGAAVAMAVMLIAGVATWIPARRAAAVDPLMAMRVE